MTQYELEDSREYKAAMALEDALNSYSWNPETFALATRCFHRTLSQELFRTMVATIKSMAADDYGYDLRNEAAHTISQSIVNTGVLNDAYIPFI